ncbi:MAG: hypothetical protein JNK85_19815 [Verrucomicrobiales bacterium]|nr:hypothetical protein [Verrucomicrobiales bacterium]
MEDTSAGTLDLGRAKVQPADRGSGAVTVIGPTPQPSLDADGAKRQTARMPGVLAQLLRGSSEILRLASFFDATADPWERMPHAVPAKAFGLASERDFGVYLQGPSTVQARNLEELCAWLRCCDAVDDNALFFQPDYWQHPVTFEHLRKGDCEDHALWAWRQLHRLGIPSLFMAGLWESTAHAWVLIEQSPVPCLLESTAKVGPMLHPLPGVRMRYCPALAVDTQGRTYVYQGYPRFREAGSHKESPPSGR